MPAILFWTSLAIVSGAFLVVAAAAWGVGRSVLESGEG